MRFISRKIHAVLDYVVGILLIVAPWILGFADVASAKWTAIAVGVLVLITSALTDYEGGGKKVLSMSTHLTMDIVAGIFLAISPWLFGFSESVYLPHLILGIFSIIAGLCTQTKSQHTSSERLDNLRHAH